MDRWMDVPDGHPQGAVGADVAAMAGALRRLAGQLADIRRHALSVTLLSWESPAGTNFRSYLVERCAELARTIDLMESAAQQLGEYGVVIHDAEVLHRQAGL